MQDLWMELHYCEAALWLSGQSLPSLHMVLYDLSHQMSLWNSSSTNAGGNTMRGQLNKSQRLLCPLG